MKHVRITWISGLRLRPDFTLIKTVETVLLVMSTFLFVVLSCVSILVNVIAVLNTFIFNNTRDSVVYNDRFLQQ